MKINMGTSQNDYRCATERTKEYLSMRSRWPCREYKMILDERWHESDSLSKSISYD